MSNLCEGAVAGLPFVGVEEAVDFAMFRAKMGCGGGASPDLDSNMRIRSLAFEGLDKGVACLDTGDNPPFAGVGGKGNLLAMEVAEKADPDLGVGDIGSGLGEGEGVEQSLTVLGSVCSDTASRRRASLRDSGNMGLPSADERPRPIGAPPGTPIGNELPAGGKRDGAEGVF